MNYKIIQAPNMKQAMIKIHQEMGPHALIIKTRKSVGGIEVLAGLEDESQAAQTSIYSTDKISHNSAGQYALEERLDELTRKITELSGVMHRKKKIWQTLFNTIGMTAKIIQRSIQRRKISNVMYRAAKNKVAAISEILSKSGLSKKIMLKPSVAVSSDNSTLIRALVGPSGSGKTTTLIKIAVQFSMNYDLNELGIISTNVDDLYIRNKLSHFCHLYRVDFSYAQTPDELNRVIDSMKNKRLILIDTHGMAQRDVLAVSKQRSLLEKSLHDISVYLTLSASQQIEVIEDTIKYYSFKKMSGCIITKVDEALRLEPVIETITRCRLAISYVCNGEDLDGDIYQLSDEFHTDILTKEEFSDLPIRQFGSHSLNWI